MLRDVEGIGLYEPDVPINSRAFGEPAFVLGSVYANDENVVFVVVQEIGDVETEWRVAAQIAAKINSVEHHDRITKDSVEFERKPTVGVARGNFEYAAIAADTGFGKVAANWLVSVVPEFGRVDEWKSDGEIVRQVDGLPLAVVEITTRGQEKLARFGEGSAFAVAEISGGIVGVAEVKSPVEIEEKTLARRCVGSAEGFLAR